MLDGGFQNLLELYPDESCGFQAVHLIQAKTCSLGQQGDGAPGNRLSSFAQCRGSISMADSADHAAHAGSKKDRSRPKQLSASEAAIHTRQITRMFQEMDFKESSEEFKILIVFFNLIKPLKKQVVNFKIGLGIWSHKRD